MNDFLCDLRDFWEDNWEMIVIITFIGGIIVFILTLFLQPTHSMQIRGFLVGKEYSPAESHTGVGTGVDANGNSTTVVTTSSTSQKWTVILQEGTEYNTYDVSPKVFYSLQENTTVTLNCVEGNWIPLISCLGE